MFTICECREKNIRLNETVKDYFTIDSIGVKSDIKPLKSIENKRANDIIKRKIKNIGRKYEIGLLWAKDNIVGDTSLNSALLKGPDNLTLMLGVLNLIRTTNYWRNGRHQRNVFPGPNKKR
jgi:hypothetical protein